MSILKDFLGEKLYNKQKKIVNNLINNTTKKGKEVINDIISDSYIVQKKIVNAAQKELEKEIKKQYELKAGEFLDKAIEAIRSKGFIGRILAKVLKMYRNDILSAIGAK